MFDQAIHHLAVTTTAIAQSGSWIKFEPIDQSSAAAAASSLGQSHCRRHICCSTFCSSLHYVCAVRADGYHKQHLYWCCVDVSIAHPHFGTAA